ncbi:MAG: tRNA preQ1(34) S-adenosylmethionine ribosyltransferase-isomerase QueA [Anaerolineae bacterium]
MLTAEFDYDLPPELIAQTPIEPRDASRLMVVDRGAGTLAHRRFGDVASFLCPGDLVVLNESRVLPARLRARKVPTGGRVELLLLTRHDERTWEALVGGRRAPQGTRLVIEEARNGNAEGTESAEGKKGTEGTAVSAVSIRQQMPMPRGAPRMTKTGTTTEPEFAERTEEADTALPPESSVVSAPSARSALPVPPFSGQALTAEVVAETPSGGRLVRFDEPVEDRLDSLGEIPLPPYIRAPLADAERYQTVYARERGSVAAPTAGLHFTPGLLKRLAAEGIETATVTLHIGLDTFRPVQEERVEEHAIHREWCRLDEATAAAVRAVRERGRRIVAVGTTSVRVLETAARHAEALGMAGPVAPFAGWTDLYIYPGYRFRAVDALITNFHLPRSTLLMLVSAFAGRDLVLRAYQEAIREGYRFYSLGDAMLIL